MLPHRVSKKEDVAYVCVACPEPVTAAHKSKFVRCTTHRRRDLGGSFDATLSATAEKCSKISCARINQSYRLVLDIVAHKSDRSEHCFWTAQLLKSHIVVRVSEGGQYKKKQMRHFLSLLETTAGLNVTDLCSSLISV